MATENYLPGIKTVGDFATNQDPEWFDNTIHRFEPEGMAPLLALLTRVGKQSIVTSGSSFADHRIHWFERRYPEQNATITGVFNDTSLSDAYTSGGVAGDTVFVKMSAVDSQQFRVRHQVLIGDTTDNTNHTVGRVTAKSENGASSYIAVKLIEADDNSTSSDMSDANTVLVISSASAQASEPGNVLTRTPNEFTNNTQIVEEFYKISRNAAMTGLRTGDAKQEVVQEAFERYMVSIEKALWHGVKSSTISEENGDLVTTMDGILSFIRTNASANVFDFPTDSGFSGQTWIQGGVDFLADKLEILYRESLRAPAVFAGSTALTKINQLAFTYGNHNMETTRNKFGTKVTIWQTAHGDIPIFTNPLFSQEPLYRDMMVVLDLSKIKMMTHLDTTFIPKAEPNGADYIKQGWRSEFTGKYLNPESMGIFTGIGTTNTV